MVNYDQPRGVKMSTRTNKSFREEAVRLALSSPQPYAKTARDLGIKESSLYTWISNHKNQAETDAPKKQDIDLLTENRRLQKEVLRLKEEREILKKAAKFFANEQK